MLEIRTLLVPTDFSAGAERALDEAIALARRLGSAIRLLHCYRLPTELELTYLGGLEDWESGIRAGAARQLEEIGARAAGQGLTVTRELVHGEPSSEILRAAASHADLLVMGTLGRTGLAHLLLGSVAERTAREAPCPVLVVRPRDTPPALPKTLLVPIDFSPGSDRSVALARELMTQLGGDGRVVLVHAHDVEDLPRVPQPHLDSLAWALAEFAPKELEEMSAELKRCGLGCSAHIERGHPAQVIAERARAEQADWIVMSSHGHSGPSRWRIGSVTARVLRTAPCSVLVLRSR